MDFVVAQVVRATASQRKFERRSYYCVGCTPWPLKSYSGLIALATLRSMGGAGGHSDAKRVSRQRQSHRSSIRYASPPRSSLDVNTTMNEGFVQGTPCVSGPNAGAMGVHFILPSRAEEAGRTWTFNRKP